MKKQTEEPTTINKYKILTIVFAVVLLLALAFLARGWMTQKEAQKEYEKLSSQVNSLQNELNDNAITIPSTDTEDTGVQETTQQAASESSQIAELGLEVPPKNLDWKKLNNINADIYAWIYIPGTDIDYPILQHPTDDTYYLNYNMNGTRGYPGCIYTELANRKDFTDFDTVLYGHNMRNNSMFAMLHKYEDREFFENYPYVYIYTKDRVLVYEIIAAYQTGDAHILHTNDFSSDEGRLQYLETIVKYTDDSAKVRNPVELSVDSHLLTMSTCVSRQADKRFLVQAVLLNEEDL